MHLAVDESIVGAFVARMLGSTGGTASSHVTGDETGPADDRVRSFTLGDAIGDGRPDSDAAPFTVFVGRSSAAASAPSARTTVVVTGLGGDEISANQRAWIDSGLASLTHPVHDGDDRPQVPFGPHASVLAGAYALLAAEACGLAERTGRVPPSKIEIDAVAVLRSLPQHPFGVVQLPGVNADSGRIRVPGSGVFDCVEGRLYLFAVEDRQWLALLGVVDDGRAPVSDERRARWMRDHPDELKHLISAWVSSRTANDAAEQLRAARVPVGRVLAPRDVARTSPSDVRGFDPSAGRFVPWRFVPAERPSTELGAIKPMQAPSGSGRPLDGLRVLDLTWAWAGPFATTLLAELGAEVINIEWHPRQSNLRVQAPFVSDHPTDASAWWSANQRGKYSVGVNLKHPEGRALVLDLAARSHLVMENFAPGVTARLGLDYEDLVGSNPLLSYVSMSAFGHGAPADDWIGYGPQLWYEAGLATACADPNVDLIHMGIPYPDPVSGVFGALAALAVLRQGGGHADVSEVEATALTELASLAGLDPGDTTSPSTASTPSLADILENEGHDWPLDQSAEFRESGLRLAPSPFRLDDQRLDARRGAPRLFEHTELVLRELLGLPVDRIDRLAEDGAIAVRTEHIHTWGSTS